MGCLLRFATDAGPYPGGRLMAMARRSVRRSVQTKSWTDQVCGAKPGTALRVYPSLEQQAPIHLPHHFAEPSRDRALRFHSIAEARADHPPPIRRFEKSWRRGILLPLLSAPLLCVNL